MNGTILIQSGNEPHEPIPVSIVSVRVVLFPLDCGRWFGGDVVAYAVDSAHMVDDVV